MLVKMVFIHCEKSAGSSYRALLIQNYGREKIFWHGLDDKKLLGGSYSWDDNYLIVGGHISYVDFSNSPHRILFTSAVREPISRAVSLYNFFCEKTSEETRKYWINKGLDPKSMLKSIEFSREFRNQISNTQCYRISGKKDYKTTLNVLNTENFLVGKFENLHAFNYRLGDLLDWPNISLGLHNVAKRSDYQNEILSEPGLYNSIIELNQEDIKLYSHIAEQDVYEHIPDKNIFKTYLSVSRYEEEKETRPMDIAGIHLTISNEDKMILSEGKNITVRLDNSSKIPLTATGPNPIMIAYHWCDNRGQIVEWEGARTRLPRNVFPGETLEIDTTVLPPKNLPPGDYKLRFGLLQLGVRWLETVDNTHTTELDVRTTISGSS